MALIKLNAANTTPDGVANREGSQNRKYWMKQAVARYVVSFQAEPFYKGKRYYWMICWAQNPDELVSWGHAPKQELAEMAARNEVNSLYSGLTQGGRVTTSKSVTHHG